MSARFVLRLRVELGEHFPIGRSEGANGYCSAGEFVAGVGVQAMDFFV